VKELLPGQQSIVLCKIYNDDNKSSNYEVSSYQVMYKPKDMPEEWGFYPGKSDFVINNYNKNDNFIGINGWRLTHWAYIPEVVQEIEE